jgi:pimeloyl-ACP methyl ester carboxylesterase
MKLMVQGREAYAYTGGKPFDPSLPVLVLLHGALHDHSVWTLLARYFAHHGRAVLAPDLPGHGRSAGPALGSVEELGAWVLALLAAANMPDGARVSLAGHSMGSLIALEAAAQAPQRCERLLMLATAWPMKVSEALFSRARENPRSAMALVNSLSHASLAAKPSYPGPGAWLHGGNQALMERMQASSCEPHLFLHDFGLCDRYQGAPAAAAAVREAGRPAYLILGERDVMTPPKAAQALGELLQADVQRLPAGHSLMTEAPEALLNAFKGACP